MNKAPEIFLLTMLSAICLMPNDLHAQNNTCPLAGRFGIDAKIYSSLFEENGISTPTFDWFTGNEAGSGVITETEELITSLTEKLQTESNPMYTAPQRQAFASQFDGIILIDAIFARDEFGGTGHIDQTSFVRASKNGEDPAMWAPGPANVLGKNDIIDLAGFMFRDGTTINDDLWFVGLFNMAEPGGTSYMDFEFFVESVIYDPDQQKFNSGGPQLGHTAYVFKPDLTDPENPEKYHINQIGDFIFSVSLLSSGPLVETRLWVSRADWLKLGGPSQGSTATFQWAGTFDGAFNNAPYGYAGILPREDEPFCGVINTSPTAAPPWGTLNTKSHVWGTSYQINSLAEVAINLTAYGMDHASLLGDDECYFPLNTFIVKTRSSASFTAQLKDFAGPYGWGSPAVSVEVISEKLSCNNTIAEVIAIPSQPDYIYNWSTINGNIVEQVAGEPWKIRVDKPGTYVVTVEIDEDIECFEQQTASTIVEFDQANPLFNDPILLATTTACGDDDGTISLNVTGAVGTYTYTLFRDGSFFRNETGIDPGNHMLTDLVPGTYSVTIQGAGECTAFIDDIEIKGRTPLEYTPEPPTHVTCFGLQNGKIEMGTVSGTGTLSYLWSTGNTTKDLLNVGAGSYTVQITDGDGCVTTQTFTISEPAALTADTTPKNDENPDPAIGDGSITLNVTGGTGSLTFSWEIERDGVTTEVFSTDKNLENLRRGKYTVTITDENGCTFTTFENIWEPEICYDGIDNSGNGLVDCDDPECPVPVPTLTKPENIPCIEEPVTYIAVKPEMPVGVDPADYTFEWTLPGNVDIESGDPDQDGSIILRWTSTAGGQICVRGVINWPGDFACYSTKTCIVIEVEDVPPQPGDILINKN